MHIVQATAWYPPYGLGGTEVYLASLIEELQSLGVASSVLTPQHHLALDRYEHHGVAIETYPVNEAPTRSELRHRHPHAGFEQFRAALARARNVAPIYHQHSWTRGCGLDHLTCARELGFRTVVTVHVPGNICLRGTMMRSGTTQCDGLIEATRCGGCYLEGRGLPPTLARTVATLPQAVANRARGAESRLATALSARVLASEKRDQFRAMTSKADGIVAVCQWLYDALAANGVPKHKLHLSRQGVQRQLADALKLPPQSPAAPGGKAPLRILLLGRWDPIKGIDVLVRAIVQLPADCAVELTVHANAAERAYETRVRSLAAHDRRVTIAGPVERSALPETLARHEVLAVPSQCLETGPLVVLEAQAAGLFVLGSRLGGIAELIAEPEAGMLVEPSAPRAWADAIKKVAMRHANHGLPRAAAKVRTMDAVADEMAQLYRTL